MQSLYYLNVAVGLVVLLGGLALGQLAVGAGAIVFLGVSSLGFWLERRKWVLSGRIIFTALVFGIITLLFILYGTYSPIAFFYAWPLAVALLLIGPEVTLGLATATAGLLLILFGMERFLNLYHPALQLPSPLSDLCTLLGVIVLVVSGGAGYLQLSRRLLTLQSAMRQQGVELTEILGQQARTRTAYQNLGQEVAITTSQLLTTSGEQAGRASQQVNAIAQVTTSMQELSQTASQIAERSRSAQQLSEQATQAALDVALATAQVSEASQRGQQSVAETASSNQLIQTAYQNLNNSLNQLTEKAERIQAMLDLIESVADETHLLALNAAIEAAGAGEHGERFNVVAQEVKQLADRARRTTDEVRVVVSEVDAALKTAREEASQGDSIAQKAASSARQSAQSITELETMITEAARQTAEIARQITKVEELAQSIGSATRLQQNASEQVLASLLTVKTAAEANALASSQLAESTSRLQNLASQFNSET
jgi:methyl-accepting chemotaxis protein